MRTPLTYYGGKQRLAPQLLELLAPNPVFVEPFAGGLAVLFARRRAEREIVNDVDGAIVAFWEAVRDHPEQLAAAIATTPYGRTEFDRAKAAIRSTNDYFDDVVETARQLLTSVDQAYARASDGAWSAPSLLLEKQGRWQPGTWTNLPGRILAAAQRLQGVALEHCDAVDLIERCDEPGVTIYADPPYPKSTRSSGGSSYRRDDDGALWPRLVPTLAALEHAHVVLSGYPGAATDPLENAGWERIDLVAGAASSTSRRHLGGAPEAVWLCPRTTATRSQLQLFAEARPS